MFHFIIISMLYTNTAQKLYQHKVHHNSVYSTTESSSVLRYLLYNSFIFFYLIKKKFANCL